MRYIKTICCKTIILKGIIGVTVFVFGILAGYGLYKENNLKDLLSSKIFPYSTAPIDSTDIEITKRKDKNGIVEVEAIVKNKKILEEPLPLQITIFKGTGYKKEIISRSQYFPHFGKNSIKIKRIYFSCHISIGYFRKKDFYHKKIPVFYSKTLP